MPCNLDILIAESNRFSAEAVAELTRLGRVRLADLDQESLQQAMPEFDLVWVRLRNRIDAQMFQAAPRLKALATPTTGLNHIDLAAAECRGIEVFSLRGETEFLRDVRATAELTIGLMLALLRHIPSATTHTRAGGWARDRFRGSELFGKTVGVVGYGRLGKLVATYLNAFGANIIVSDPYICETNLEPPARRTSLQQLLAQADLVTLHVNLTEQTRGFFGRPQINSMKPGALLVNTSRGELLDEAALLDALHSGKLAGAALDVLADEYAGSIGSNPLIEYSRQHDNVLITPHIGGCTVESMAKTEVFLARKIATTLLARDH